MIDDPEQSSRSRTQILEILHVQVVNLHSDLYALDKQIDDIQAAAKRRRELLGMKAVAGKTERTRLNIELEACPLFKPMTIIKAIESKAKIRDKICTTSMQIARLNSLLDRPMPVIQAIERLATAELIPSETANSLIKLLNGLETAVDRVGGASLN